MYQKIYKVDIVLKTDKWKTPEIRYIPFGIEDNTRIEYKQEGNKVILLLEFPHINPIC